MNFLSQKRTQPSTSKSNKDPRWKFANRHGQTADTPIVSMMTLSWRLTTLIH